MQSVKFLENLKRQDFHFSEDCSRLPLYLFAATTRAKIEVYFILRGD
jgi:hypothetical protein